MTNTIESAGVAAATASRDDHIRDDMFKAWQQVIYALTEDNFNDAWRVINEEYADQKHILRYISSEYMP